MKTLKTLLPVIAVAALVQAMPALADEGDMTKADNVTCRPDRMAVCKTDGSCNWRTATERDKARPLIIDFKAKQAFIKVKDKTRFFGLVLEDKVDGDKRAIVISKDKTRNPRTTLELSLDKVGKLKGTRSQGRVKIEATCAAS